MANDAATIPQGMARAKAFLSHSSFDKAFVEAVALRLGRIQVAYDKWSFHTGDEFIKAIPDVLNASDVFVLFASRESLSSLWVKLEIEHAQALLERTVLRKALVFIIDDFVSHSDLPKWMQGALADKYSSPNSVARVIQAKLDSLRGVKQVDYFFGRDQLLNEFSQKLFPTSELLPPNLLVIAGLSGIGRRTFARRVLEDRLSLRMGPRFHLRKGDGFDALHLALLSETSPLSTKDSISIELEAFREESTEEKTKELCRLLNLASEGKVAPVIVDDGSLIESNGSYTDEAIALIRQLHKTPQLIVVLIQSRLSTDSKGNMGQLGVAGTRVPPLDTEASRQLLTRRLIDNGLTANSDQIASLVPALSGYPPAFNTAATYARDYGLSTLLNNKAVLTSFQQLEFADLLSALTLTNHEWGILRLLAAGMELPIEGIMAATRQPAEVIVPSVQRLVDLSLILNNSGILAVAGPVTYAVQAEKGPIQPNDYAFIGKVLKETFWDTEDSIPDFGILEATITALLRSEEPDLSDFKHFVVPSMLFRNATYHYKLGGQEHWLKAKAILGSMLKLEPKNVRALCLSMKIQVRLRKWKDAERTLSEIKETKAPDSYFLEGFLLWKRKNFSGAVPHFKNALRLGQKAPEIYHALATCLFRLGDPDGAMAIIRDGLKGRARQMVLLVDLAALIAIDRNDLEEAEKYVEQLRRLKADSDYHHRAATLLNVQHKLAEALNHARISTSGPRPRFEARTTLVNILIEMRKFPQATNELDRLDEAFKHEEERRDVLLGLRCKLLLRQGNWKQAEDLWHALNDTESAVHAALRKEILQQKINDSKTTLSSKSAAQLELQSLIASPTLDGLSLSDLFGIDEAVADFDRGED